MIISIKCAAKSDMELLLVLSFIFREKEMNLTLIALAQEVLHMRTILNTAMEIVQILVEEMMTETSDIVMVEGVLLLILVTMGEVLASLRQ